VKLQRIVAASALLCGRSEARVSDLWVLRNIWHTDDQREILRALVQEIVAKDEAREQRHPGADGANTPDPEALARELAWLTAQAGDAANHAVVRDRLAIAERQIPWVAAAPQRDELAAQAKQLWSTLPAA
jgi:MoxR-like ATPase